MERNEKIISEIGDAIKFLFTRVILTWQLILLVFIIMFSSNIAGLFENIGGIKVGSFEVTLIHSAKYAGITDTTLKKLKYLNNDALQVFLIKGGEHGNDVDYTLKWLSPQDFYSAHKLLDSLGLIKVNWALSYVKDNFGNYHIEDYPTMEGRALHTAILQATLNSLQNIGKK